MSLNFCNAYEDILILVASGAASAEEANRAQAHLDACGHCRRELERLRGMISAIDQACSPIPSSTAPQSLHANLMRRLRVETAGWPKRTTAPFWMEPLQSWCLWRRAAWRRAALSIVTVAIAFTVWHFGVNQSVVQSGKSADGRHDNLVRVNSNQGEPAGPVELRLALSRSFEDFEMALRQNDQLLATREPMVVPSKSRSAELQ
jgi:anti-sigma factor RsiW